MADAALRPRALRATGEGRAGRVPRVVKARAARTSHAGERHDPVACRGEGCPGDPTSKRSRSRAHLKRRGGSRSKTRGGEASDGAAGRGGRLPTRTPEAEEEDEEEEEEEATAVERQARRDDEPASFLAMYFRDMAELDVLRPEQEFETARNIEELELDLWRTVLGFAPGTDWILDVVEREARQAAPRGEAAPGGRRAGAQQVVDPGAQPVREDRRCSWPLKLRVLDIDRHLHRRGADRDPARRPRDAAACRSRGRFRSRPRRRRSRDYVEIGRAARRSGSRRRRTSS